MLLDTRTTDADVAEAGSIPVARRAAVGVVAARIADAAPNELVVVMADEDRAAALAAMLRAFLPDHEIAFLPAPDQLPGEAASPSPAVAGRRAAALRRVHERGVRPAIVVGSAEAATWKLPAAAAAEIAVLRVGEAVDGEAIAALLEQAGYRADDRVDEPGEFAVRGQVIDLYPADADAPARIDVEDGRITSVRRYDALTQRGADAVGELRVEPAAEPSLQDGITLFDLLPGAPVAIEPGCTARRDAFLALAADMARPRDGARAAGLIDAETWAGATKGRPTLDIAAGREDEVPRFAQRRDPARASLRFVRASLDQGRHVVLSGARRDLRFLVRRTERDFGTAPTIVRSWAEVRAAAPGSLLALEADVDRGWDDGDAVVIAAADVLGSRAGATSGGAADPLTGEVIDFHLGDAVIHEDHGLALLGGIETVTTGDGGHDAIRLEHAAGAHRLVPIEDAGRLWRYGAEAVTLDKLDGSTWSKRRAQIDEATAETARALVAMAAERDRRTAPALEPPAAAYERFAGRFPFTETADQLRAIEAVRADLASGKPMDRLVVGDVGYGKTEVALRAAAIATLAGRQVAIVAPTTVLVRQHLETFRRRFAELDIEVAALSRLSTPAEVRAVKKGLADGSIDIVIGTQAVAGKGVGFDRLALVVIDEEQRFGAADKRRLRGLAADTHVLTLTATPIPRTLQSALVGIQQLSVIATPPARRQPIRTLLRAYDAATVRAALLRERARGGQSFVVVPRIEDMGAMAARLRELVPELVVREAHGKLPAADLDAVMVRFADGDGDVLLATNIIEAGLDVPRANTMIVWHADRFGLSQLHQLRGRVGRGRLRGEILLLTEAGAEIAPATLKRLGTLEALDRLGAGFAISARDLDLRGAGELLGEEQAGHMKLIGTDLYQHLLGLAVRTARGETVDDWTPELNLEAAGCLPEDWIPEADLRVNLYVRLARTAAPGDLDALAQEMEDRFGTTPDAARQLLALVRARHLCRAAKVARIDAGPAAIALTPRPDFDDAAAERHDLVRKGDRFLLPLATEPGDARIAAVVDLLERLSPQD